MIVMAIIGILAGIAGPFFHEYRQNINLKEAARDLYSDIALCRHKAVAENVHYKVTFNQTANSYTILRGGQLSTDSYVADVTKSPNTISSQVIICNITFTGTPPQIIFEPRGTTSTLGRVILRHTGIEKNAEITTNITGRIYVSYNNNACP